MRLMMAAVLLALVAWRFPAPGNAAEDDVEATREAATAAAVDAQRAADEAQKAADAAAAVAKALKAGEKARQQVATEIKNKEFLGVKFGFGFGATIGRGTPDRIADAEIREGIVRVTKRANSQPRVLLESHLLWRLKSAAAETVMIGTEAVPGVQRAWLAVGPFLALQASTDSAIDAIGGGIMFGFRVTDGGGALNVGVGAMLDGSAQVLADDFKANQPAPAGATEVQFRDEDRWGILLMVSFSI